jgi:hypothetical protein
MEHSSFSLKIARLPLGLLLFEQDVPRDCRRPGQKHLSAYGDPEAHLHSTLKRRSAMLLATGGRSPMPDWSIKIVAASHPNPRAPAAFRPDVPGAAPGAPLQAQDDDLVSWDNTTNETHWPWPTGPDFVPLSEAEVPRTSPLYLSDRVLPGQSSRPSYNVLLPNANAKPPPQSGTIYYCCKLHPGEHGTIVVTAVPSPLPQPPPATS